MAAGLVYTIVDRLSRQYPRLAFRVTIGDLPDLQDRELREHDIDLMIGRLPDVIPAEDTETEILFEETAFVVAGMHNPWTRRRKIELAELINEPWTLSTPESFPGSLVERAFRARGLEVPRRFAIQALANRHRDLEESNAQPGGTTLHRVRARGSQAVGERSVGLYERQFRVAARAGPDHGPPSR
jgi:DNA-binding transcriptional LysR family regulator